MNGKFISLLYYLILTACCCISKREDKNTNTRIYGQQNAIWSESIYLRGYQPTTKEKLTDEQVIRYANLLKKNNIKFAYLFAGPYSKTGNLPEYAFSETASKSIALIKKCYPELIVLPWIGGVQNSTVNLGDSIWVENALNDTQKLISFLNVSGVHIDFEYILPGDRYLDSTTEAEKPGDKEAYAMLVNEFHRRLRELNPSAFISSVVACTAPEAKQWKQKTSIKELKELNKYVDQISFLFYDTSIGSQKEFENACRNQLADIEILRKSQRNRNCQYLFAIGTFINREELQKYRDLDIENIVNTLNTLKNEIKNIKQPQNVSGIAIFCDWETDQSEWDQIYENWTGI